MDKVLKRLLNMRKEKLILIVLTFKKLTKYCRLWESVLVWLLVQYA